MIEASPLRAQGAAAPQCRPDRCQQRVLLAVQGRDVSFLPQQFDIRMTAYHTGRRTRRIQQNPVERLSVPPGAQIGCIGRPHRGTQTHAIEVCANQARTLIRNIDRNNLPHLGERFEQMEGLTTRRSANIGYSVAGSRP